jgi:hypothetical protein
MRLASFLPVDFWVRGTTGGKVKQNRQDGRGIRIQDTRRLLEFYSLISKISCRCGGRVTIGYDGCGRISQVYPVCTLCGEDIEVSTENRMKLERLLGEAN